MHVTGVSQCPCGYCTGQRQCVEMRHDDADATGGKWRFSARFICSCRFLLAILSLSVCMHDVWLVSAPSWLAKGLKEELNGKR